MKTVEQTILYIKIKIMMGLPLSEREYCLYKLYSEKANQKVEVLK